MFPLETKLSDEELEMIIRVNEESPFVAAARSRLRIRGYELRESIGKGGMSQVFAAVRSHDQQHFAVKIYLADDDDRIKLFRAETQALLAIGRQETIVEMIDHEIVELERPDGQTMKVMYLILERGENDLRNELAKRKGPLEDREIAIIIQIVARALQQAHEKCIIHQDIKLDNVIKFRDTWKLTDFGGAHHRDPTLFISTSVYSYPLQAKEMANAPQPLKDLFLLGTAFYELLTGRLIDQKDQNFQRGFVPKSPRRHITRARPDDARTRRLERICLGCLHPDRRYSYDSAIALIDDLRRYLEGDEIRLPSQPFRQQLWLHIKARKRLSLVVALLIFGGVWFSINSAVALRRQVLQFHRNFEGLKEQIVKEKEEARRPLIETTLQVKAAHTFEIEDLSKIEKVRDVGTRHLEKFSSLVQQGQKLS